MSSPAFCKVAASLFGIVALAHAARLASTFPSTSAQRPFPCGSPGSVWSLRADSAHGAFAQVRSSLSRSLRQATGSLALIVWPATAHEWDPRLSARFPDAYAAFCRQTPRWL